MPPLALRSGDQPFFGTADISRIDHQSTNKGFGSVMRYEYSAGGHLPRTPPPGAGGGKGWNTDKSSTIYKIGGWGAPYFYINDSGHICVHPHGLDTKPSEEIDLMDVVQRVVDKTRGGLNLPLIIRFPDVLKHRIETFQSAFQLAIAAQEYQGAFRGVFPVKCNPDRRIVEDIITFGKEYHYGLEAGSKPELLTVMSCMCKSSPSALLICNGYKDSEYIGLALRARQLKLNSIIVLEQEVELDIVIRTSQCMGVKPVIGLRAKLSTKHGGHWGETSGDEGKFGLSTSEMVRIVAKLRNKGMLDCLQLLHFHIGSQIPSLAIVQEGVSEAAHIFCELALMGANMNFIDIGGGLGVDYDGSHSAQSDMSIGYTVEEYAEEVMAAIKDACILKNVKQPTVCCESGRAIVSHQSVLVFDVLSAHRKGGQDQGVPLELKCEGLPKNVAVVHEELKSHLNCKPAPDYDAALECAMKMKAECASLFKSGLLSLEVRASVDSIYEVLAAAKNEVEHKKYMALLDSLKIVSDSKKVLPASNKVTFKHNATYHVNLSVFKSMPDYWAIGQLFPIVPIHRLEEEPTTRAVLCDLTCDSDGKVSKFIGKDIYGEQKQYLEVHPFEVGKPYYMGLFLGGAYQEILGGMHNLFGTTNVVHVVQNRDSGTYEIQDVVQGQAIADVQRVMQHEPHLMYEVLKGRVEETRREGMPGNEREILNSLDRSFSSYTYLLNDQIRGCYSFTRSKLPPTVVAHSQPSCC